MGRFLLGLGLLLGFLLLCLAVAFFAQSMHEPICQSLDSAAQLALEGKGAASLALIQEARELWDQKWHQTAAFSDHGPMDEIDSLFAQLEMYGQSGSTLHMAPLCARLSQRIRAIAEGQGPAWWNVL